MAAVQVQRFCCGIIDAIQDVAVAVKVQSAFFEVLGPAGVEALAGVAGYASSRGLLVIGDVKRGDIGSTAEAYAGAYLGPVQIGDASYPAPFELDAITVNPYLGDEGLTPFVEACARQGKGLFVLVRTSNPSSDRIQGQHLAQDPTRQLFDLVTELVQELASRHFPGEGYQPIGAVAGATHPEDLRRVRTQLPRSLLLVPGYGAQGATADDLVHAFDSYGFGALVNASRSVIFAYRSGGREGDPFEAARAAAEKMRQEISSRLPASWHSTVGG